MNYDLTRFSSGNIFPPRELFNFHGNLLIGGSCPASRMAVA
jgi:hypothetical protein